MAPTCKVFCETFLDSPAECSSAYSKENTPATLSSVQNPREPIHTRSGEQARLCQRRDGKRGCSPLLTVLKLTIRPCPPRTTAGFAKGHSPRKQLQLPTLHSRCKTQVQTKGTDSLWLKGKNRSVWSLACRGGLAYASTLSQLN